MAGDERNFGPSAAWQPTPPGAGGQDAPPPAPPSPPAPPAPPRRRGPNWLVIGLVIFLLVSFVGGMLLVGVAFMGMMSGTDGEMFGGFGDKVGVITISGVITTAGEEFAFGGSVPGARQYMAQIRAAAKDESIKAVVIRINSPGGGPAASQEIHGEIIKLADEKPVVVSMGEVAASGGYYVAVAGDKIYANPATLTGSIGVIMQTVQYQDMLDKIGVEMGAITTGPFKDTGSPVRPMREDERAMLDGMLNSIYEQFVRDVAAGRDMDEKDVRKVADGRVLTGEQALEAGLVDELGNYYDAIASAAEMAGIEGEPSVKHFSSSGGLRGLLGSLAEMQRQQAVYQLLRDFRLDGVSEMLQATPLQTN